MVLALALAPKPQMQGHEGQSAPTPHSLRVRPLRCQVSASALRWDHGDTRANKLATPAVADETRTKTTKPLRMTDDRLVLLGLTPKAKARLHLDSTSRLCRASSSGIALSGRCPSGDNPFFEPSAPGIKRKRNPRPSGRKEARAEPNIWDGDC